MGTSLRNHSLLMGIRLRCEVVISGTVKADGVERKWYGVTMNIQIERCFF